MVDLLIRDANNYDRADNRFPYLRDFDIYAGHDWASGHGAFAAGNNQESSSEGMNFAGALIQWGQATGNTAVRDAGIYLYTTQSAAIHEYWFDVDDTNFPAAFAHSTVGMVWGDGGAYATWFTADPEKIQGINLLPDHRQPLLPGLPTRPTTAPTTPRWCATRAASPRCGRTSSGSSWPWATPTRRWPSSGPNPGFTSEEGECKAHTFHWIRNLAALGTRRHQRHREPPAGRGVHQERRQAPTWRQHLHRSR